MRWDLSSLFRRHSKEIVRSLRRRGFDAEAAADLTQDAFLKVLASPPAAATGTDNPRAYLFEVSRTLGLNHRRREALLPVADLGEEALAQIADPFPCAETAVYSRQCLQQMAEALGELPEKTRRAFELHHLEGRTIAEVADELGLSNSRTWELIHRAYRHLLLRVDAF
ncbi:RNA polymerase sigma factor [Chenggangzhangella methanolivorans]|uniref:Sigma-70 family RNA polymerase sigma factor n=1 Tax=Chenggangzhangella methanolivorans TaxID=1437009 RepID=A0A9E6UMB8_9HYPH|nr:sigma-70 family RNA polymerase sigma factor [Chenggangzhangella methanolivorans]QZN99028.1 sigma-70 family RNA polymerase sigma factor [Chenggangzhangella methanolivorans]